MENENSTGVYPDHFYNYIRLVEKENLNSVLENQLSDVQTFFENIPEEKHLYQYAEGKWNVKEVLQHIIDTERVFSFRSLAFSRNDPNTFPSFNENDYIKNGEVNRRSWKSLIEEFVAVRKSTIALFKSFSENLLNRVGKASNYEMSVNALGYTIAGHVAHHVNILKERYLQK